MGSEHQEIEDAYQRDVAADLLARLPDPVLAYLEKVYGLQQLLGCGMWACAWRTKKGTVLKLTNDRRDAYNAYWLLKHGAAYHKVLAQVYQVRVITLSPEDRIFLIESEWLRTLTKKQQDLIEVETSDVFDWDWRTNERGKIQVSGSEKPRLSRLSRKYLTLQHRLQAIEAETGLRLQEDAFPHNLGFRADGRLVLYDFGSGSLEGP